MERGLVNRISCPGKDERVPTFGQHPFTEVLRCYDFLGRGGLVLVEVYALERNSDKAFAGLFEELTYRKLAVPEHIPVP